MERSELELKLEELCAKAISENKASSLDFQPLIELTDELMDEFESEREFGYEAGQERGWEDAAEEERYRDERHMEDAKELFEELEEIRQKKYGGVTSQLRIESVEDFLLALKERLSEWVRQEKGGET